MSKAATKPKTSVRAARIALVGLAGEPVASAVVAVVEPNYPEIVMFNGDPFLRGTDACAELRDGRVTYRQVRPFRLDIGE